MRLTRRAVLQSGAAALAAPAVTGLPAVVRRRRPKPRRSPHAWKHGLSLFGDLKYPDRLQAVRLRQRRTRRRAASRA